MPMLIENVIGHISDTDPGDRPVDWLQLEWYETGKRILRRTTAGGTELSLRFLRETHRLQHGDVLYADAQCLIVVEVMPCDCIAVTPADMAEMAALCYEIGNKHLSLFYEAPELLIPFEQPLYQLLLAQGYAAVRTNSRLRQPLRTTVAPHAIGNAGTAFATLLNQPSDT